MDKKDILKKVDHTLLGQTATWDDIRGILDDAMKYEAASACIPAAYVTGSGICSGKTSDLYSDRFSERI